MKKIAFLTAAASLIGACDTSTAPLSCDEDPGQATCVVQGVGAAYVTSAGTVNLISLDGARWVNWNPQSGSFSTALDVQSLEGGGLPLSGVGAAGATKDGANTFMFANAGTSYTVFEDNGGQYEDVEIFGASDDFAVPELSEVGAICRAAATDRLFFFSRSGTTWQLWDYVNRTWSPEVSFADNFGGGGAPIANVGAAVYVDGIYYLFDTSGKTWATYLGNLEFEGPFDISQLGNGTLNFR